MTEEVLARLQQIQRQALNLQAAMSAMQSQPQPGGGRGTDPSGCVSVVVDPGGLPSLIEVRTGWQRHVAPEELGPSVLLAFQQTAAEATRAWAESVDLDAWRSPAGAEQGDRPPPPLGQAFAGPRDPMALTEDVLKALNATRSQAAAPPVTSTGWDGERAVSITLAPGGLQDCTIDPQWALRYGATAVNEALAEALSEARTASEEQAARRRAEARSLDDLAREALAALASFQKLTDLPEER